MVKQEELGSDVKPSYLHLHSETQRFCFPNSRALKSSCCSQECGELRRRWGVHSTCCCSDVMARCGPTDIKFHIPVVLCVKGLLEPTGREGMCPFRLLSQLVGFRSGWFETMCFLSVQRKGEVIEKGVERFLLGHGYRSKLS